MDRIFRSQRISTHGVFDTQSFLTPAPTGVVTSQPAVDGQSQRFVGTTTNATSGTYTLTGSGGGVTVGPTAFTVTANTFDFTVTGLVAGTYTPTLTIAGDGGAGSVTGASSLVVLGISGGGSIGSSVLGAFFKKITARRRKGN